MALAQKDLEIVTEHIQKEFPILLELSSSDLTALRNNHILERGIREEERRYQKEILETIIHQMDKRFAEAREETNRRFEETNRRIAEMISYMDKRFEQVDKQFEQVDKRFEQVDKRFQSIQWMFGIGFTAITLVIKYL